MPGSIPGVWESLKQTESEYEMREFINRFMAKNPTREEIKQFYEDYILPHDPEFSTVAEVQAEFANRQTQRKLEREAIQMDREQPQVEKWCNTCQATTQSVQLCRTRFHQIETETILAAHQCPGNDATSCTKRGTHLGVIGGRSRQANDSSHEAAQEKQMINDQFRR